MDSLIANVFSHIVCFHLVKRPFQNLEDPAYYGLKNTENIRIPIQNVENGELGAWFTHPVSNLSSGSCETKPCQKDDNDDYLVKQGEVVVLYLHGNTDTRSQFHRRELHKLLQHLGYHVLAIDYRGYADSTFIWIPDEATMTHDALSAYEWLTKRCHPDARLVIWGHSLGAGVASKLGSILSTREAPRPESCYILESPFSSLADEVATFSITKVLPLDIPRVVTQSNLDFNNSLNLINVKEPILILHGEDDKIVPFRLGRKLFDDISGSCDVTFEAFDADLGLGHSNLYMGGDFPPVVKKFIQTATSKMAESKLGKS